ncbi:MAG: glutamate racemase [Oscillospiraceae bacterium]|nr:glutamate racemase [Oscillospiraceae bacterium]
MMHSKSDYIAVFDSGVGGISVLRELIRQLPQERYLYFGDSSNAPYGDKTTEQVRQLTLEAAEILTARGIKALVVACNTATSAAIRVLRERYPELIVVGIEPALKVAADRFPNGRIGIMATQVTLAEEKLSKQVDRFPNVQIHRIPAPGLVELIEAGHTDGSQVQELLECVLRPYVGQLDALVLGCTHYPFVRNAIGQVLGPDTLLLDGGAGTARQTRRCLEAAGLLYDGPGCVDMENSSADPALLKRSMDLLNRQAE